MSLFVDLVVNIYRQSFLNVNFNFQGGAGILVTRRCQEQG